MNWDCFLLNNELDLLELRLKTLEDVVDRWVVCEGDITFGGRRKQLYYNENASRFRRWRERIIHVIATGAPVAGGTWDREAHQRSCLKRGCTPSSSDVVTYTDLDEIPRPSVYRRFNVAEGINALDMRHYLYYMNNRQYILWRHGKVVSGDYWNKCQDLSAMRFTTLRPSWANGGPYRGLLPLGGWHFTWLGDAAAKKRKALDSAHCNEDVHKRFIANLKRTTTPRANPEPVCEPITRFWPKPVLQNIRHYKDLGWLKEPVTTRYL